MFKRKKIQPDQQQPQQEETVDSILSKIKNVVSGKENVKIEDEVVSKKKPSKKIVDEEPLELTEIVGEEDSPVVEEKLEGADILENILKSLDPTKFASENNQAEPEIKQNEEDEFVDVLKQIDEDFEKANIAPSDLSEVTEIVTENTPEDLNFDIEAELSQNNVEQQMVEDNIPEAIIEEPIVENKIIEEEAIIEVETIVEQVMVEEVVTEPIKLEMTQTSQENISLISDELASKSSSAIKQLLDNIPRPKIESPQFASGATVEELVLESLKPMLKEWLDKNLDAIVKDIVQKEIRKLIPRD